MTQIQKRLIAVAVGLVAVAAILGFSRRSKVQAGAAIMAARSNMSQSVVRLSVTNNTAKDFSFFFYLQAKTNSAWSNVLNQPDGAGVMRWFCKGQIDHLELGLPRETGSYRFMCGYEPLRGTPWSMKMYSRLYGIKLPGRLGVGYGNLLGRLQPWPKQFFSNTFDNEGHAQQVRSSNNGTQ